MWVGALILFMSIVPSFSQLYADSGENEYYFKRKEFDNRILTRKDASTKCSRKQGQLADVTTHEIFDFMKKKLSYFQPPRTGGKHLYHVNLRRDDVTKLFHWADGSKLTTSSYVLWPKNFDSYNETRNCGYIVMFDKAPPRITIAECSNLTSGFICERKIKEAKARLAPEYLKSGVFGPYAIVKRQASGSPPGGSGSGSGSGGLVPASSSSGPAASPGGGSGGGLPGGADQGQEDKKYNIIQKNITIINNVHDSGLTVIALMIPLVLIGVAIAYVLKQNFEGEFDVYVDDNSSPLHSGASNHPAKKKPDKKKSKNKSTKSKAGYSKSNYSKAPNTDYEVA